MSQKFQNFHWILQLLYNFFFLGAAPSLVNAETARRPSPSARTVISLALLCTNLVTWSVSGMNIPGQTEMDTFRSSGTTSWQVCNKIIIHSNVLNRVPARLLEGSCAIRWPQFIVNPGSPHTATELPLEIYPIFLWNLN